MKAFPARTEAAPYYFTYIDRVSSSDIVSVLSGQMDAHLPRLQEITEEKSLHRYAPGKWSLRQVLNHISDTERVFLSRALWFARGFTSPLPSFEQETAVANAAADEFSWASHLLELHAVRQATRQFFVNLPSDAWDRSGTASEKPFSVRAIAFIIAGHLEHHVALIGERYLTAVTGLPATGDAPKGSASAR